jgi:hypothetical protein
MEENTQRDEETEIYAPEHRCPKHAFSTHSFAPRRAYAPRALLKTSHNCFLLLLRAKMPGLDPISGGNSPYKYQAFHS